MRGSAAFRAAVAPGGVLAGPWVSNELWRRARAVPSLDLRFAENKSLGDAVSGQSLVTFTRASSGTYVGSDGLVKTATTDAPRFDHNPTTGESLGLLVEESRTNLLERSEEFDDVYWTKASSSTIAAYAGPSPDGLTTAETYTTTGGSQSIYNSTGATVTAGAAYTFSVYIKLGTMSAADYMIAVYDLSNAAFIAVDIAPTIAPTASSWSRATYTFTTPAGCTSVRVYPFRNSSSIASSTVHLWGAQLEAGAFVTSYIKNVNSALGVTRAADVVSISGSNFSSWYRQDEGTVFGSYRGVASIEGVVTRRLVEIGESGVISDRMILGYNDITASRFLVLAGSSIQAAQSVSVTQGNQIFNAAAYKTNDFINAANGTLSAGDTSGTVPAVSEMVIGNDYSSGTASSLNGTIARLVFWPQRLSNSTLANITQ